jgi:hypothetical protein
MVESVVLIEGQNVDQETLMISLANAKQLVLGRAGEMGVILHVAATTPADLGNALLDFAKVQGVTGVLLLALRSYS